MSYTIQDLLAYLISSASLGAMTFFSLVVAPNVFRTIPSEHAGAFLRGLFPHYFLINAVAAFLAAVLARQALASALFGVGGVAMLLVRFFLIPQINAARDRMLGGTASAASTFHRLHGISVGINLLDMACLAAAIVVMARA